MFASGSVIILSSTNAKTWRQVHRFSVSERDTRDPHFLIFRDKLFVYTGTAHVGPEGKRHTDWNDHFGYTTWTEIARTQLLPFAELPSAGDNSYPGFVQLDDGRALVSWYSSHEMNADGKPITAIYLAELVLAR